MLDRRTFLKGASLASTAVLLPRFAQAAPNFAFMTPFTFSLAFAPVLYAKAAGYYEKEGLALNVIQGKGAALAAQMTIAGQAQASRTGGGNYIVSRVQNNAPLISIATIAQVSPFSIVSGEAHPLKTAADIKGKTIGMASLGGSMEATLNLMLRKHHVDPSSVNKVKAADAPGTYGLLQAGRLDGFIGSVSTVVKVLGAFPKARAVPIDDGVPGQVYVALRDAVQKDPDSFVKFLRATHRSATEIIGTDDVTPIIEAIAKNFDVPGIKDLDEARPDLKQNAQLWAARGKDNVLRNVPEDWASGVQAMEDAGILKTKVDPTTLYTNAPLEKALQKS
jgi:ABC-type nitrate/sulfonate/bicarbonate transport system substrate-binding protein